MPEDAFKALPEECYRLQGTAIFVFGATWRVVSTVEIKKPFDLMTLKIYHQPTKSEELQPKFHEIVLFTL